MSIMKPRNHEQGSSILEAMIGGALLLSVTVAIYPVFGRVSNSNKQSEFKDLCTRAVKAKIQQYKSGRQVMSTATTAVGTLSSGLSLNLTSSTHTSGQNDGFMFAKYIYNMRNGSTNSDCIADYERADNSKTPVFPPTTPLAYLGTEEYLGSVADPTGVGNGPQAVCPGVNPTGNQIESCGPVGCLCTLDQTMINQLGAGFRIFVNLQRTHFLTTNSSVTGCPKEGTNWAARTRTYTKMARNYDFDGATDAIKITVTGVLDLNAAGARTNFTGITKTSSSITQFNCSASDIITPPTRIARYVLGTYNPPDVLPTDWPPSSANGAIMDMTGRPVFYALWSENNKAISVAPNNRAVYILTNSGSILRYGDETIAQTVGNSCVGAPAECTTDGSDDPAQLLEPTLFAQAGNIRSFGIKYQNTPLASDSFTFTPVAIYALLDSSEDASTDSANLAYYDLTTGTLGTPGNTTPLAILTTSAVPAFPTGIPKPASVSNSKTFDGWFLNSSGTQAYVLKNNCSDSGTTSLLSNAIYCQSVFRYEDVENLDNAASLDRVRISIKSLSP